MSEKQRAMIHETFVRGFEAPLTLRFHSEARARTVRRGFYIERARLEREAPDSEITRLVGEVQIRLSGSTLILERREPPATEASLEAALTQAGG